MWLNGSDCFELDVVKVCASVEDDVLFKIQIVSVIFSAAFINNFALKLFLFDSFARAWLGINLEDINKKIYKYFLKTCVMGDKTWVINFWTS